MNTIRYKLEDSVLTYSSFEVSVNMSLDSGVAKQIVAGASYLLRGHLYKNQGVLHTLCLSQIVQRLFN